MERDEVHTKRMVEYMLEVQAVVEVEVLVGVQAVVEVELLVGVQDEFGINVVNSGGKGSNSLRKGIGYGRDNTENLRDIIYGGKEEDCILKCCHQLLDEMNLFALVESYSDLNPDKSRFLGLQFVEESLAEHKLERHADKDDLILRDAEMDLEDLGKWQFNTHGKWHFSESVPMSKQEIGEMEHFVDDLEFFQLNYTRLRGGWNAVHHHFEKDESRLGKQRAFRRSSTSMETCYSPPETVPTNDEFT
ncbi:hypothetical protein L2E82_28073 [Cichorium intybus]|uniref:Uncharacterized protein n=1 Tax=Cichorium intybus TaxID=13427 RepID=A0ACB9CUX0_CICIN|nr:hypothetical protein L2E82_28073 [Cichorium intybus]